jgi:hypothetical protein
MLPLGALQHQQELLQETVRALLLHQQDAAQPRQHCWLASAAEQRLLASSAEGSAAWLLFLVLAALPPWLHLLLLVLQE